MKSGKGRDMAKGAGRGWDEERLEIQLLDEYVTLFHRHPTK